MKSVTTALADGFQCHVAGPLHGPFVVMLEQQCADEAEDGSVIGEDADDLGPALDLAVEPLDRVDGMQLDAMLLREAHIGEHIGSPHP